MELTVIAYAAYLSPSLFGCHPGTQPFGPLTLLTRPPTLIPRPETEEWTIRLASFITSFLSEHRTPVSPSDPIRVLDLCTGSGCIPLLLCELLPKGSVHSVGVDVSKSASELAHENSVVRGSYPGSGDDRKGLDGRLDGTCRTQPQTMMNTFTPLLADIRKRSELSSLLRSLPYPPASLSSSTSLILSNKHKSASKPFKPFTVLTANPPYITPSAYQTLDPSVRDYEDPGALIGTEDIRAPLPGMGLGFYYDIATLAREGGILAGDGDEIHDDAAEEKNEVGRHGGCAVVAMEVGDGQAGAVVDIVKDGMPGFEKNVEVWKDAFGVERVVVATRSP